MHQAVRGGAHAAELPETPATLLLRQAAMTVPVEQIVLAWAITAGAALGMIWVAGRVLRFGMLR